MTTHRELLLSLREGFESLEPFDSSGLKALRHRGEMIIRRVFGKDSPYIERLSNIAFSVTAPLAVSSNPSVNAESQQRRRRSQEGVWLAGQKEAVSLVDIMPEEHGLEEAPSIDGGELPTPPDSNRVFVVHGHDEGMRESVARVLSRLGLEPVILHEQPDRGRTIIEKFYEHSDVGFAVVLLSPDDIGYAEAEGADAAQPRARQNVILELGFFLGKLGRDRVVALHKGSVDIPTDYSGVLFKPYVSGGDWPYQLTRELIAGGYDVDTNKLFRQG